MANIKVRDKTWLYCEKHKGWFFSETFAKSGKIPKFCPICKNPKFWKKKVRGGL